MSLKQKRADMSASIDASVENVLTPAPLMAKSMAASASEEPTDEEKVVWDLQTIYPIIKSIFAFVRPLLFFKPKWRTIIDRFIAGLDVIIPEKGF